MALNPSFQNEAQNQRHLEQAMRFVSPAARRRMARVNPRLYGAVQKPTTAVTATQKPNNIHEFSGLRKVTATPSVPDSKPKFHVGILPENALSQKWTNAPKWLKDLAPKTSEADIDNFLHAIRRVDVEWHTMGPTLDVNHQQQRDAWLKQHRPEQTAQNAPHMKRGPGFHPPV